MAKLFFDNLLSLEKIEKELVGVVESPEEKEEIWELIDEIIHHKVVGCILDKLPRGNHEEFLELVHKSPHDEMLLLDYLKKKIGENIEELLKQELVGLPGELLDSIKVGGEK